MVKTATRTSTTGYFRVSDKIILVCVLVTVCVILWEGGEKGAEISLLILECI